MSNEMRRWCAVLVVVLSLVAGGGAAGGELEAALETAPEAMAPGAGPTSGGDWFLARWDRVERVEPGGSSSGAAFVIAEAEQAQDKKPKKNEQTILSLYEAFAVGDLDTILAIIHPDVVWVESDGIPYGGTFIGRDAVFAGVFGKIAEEWDGFTAEIDLMFAAEADRVVVLGRDSGTYKATGKSMVAPAASIWTLNKDGQVVRFVQYIDTQAVNSATIP